MGMTDRDKKVMAVVLVLAVLGGYWFLFFGKNRGKIADAEIARSEAQTQLAAATAAQANAANIAKIKPVAYSRLLKLGKAVPTDDDFKSLLVQISDLSEDSDVAFLSLTANESAGGGEGGGATAGVGGTSCDAGSTGATGASAATPAPAAPTGASGSTSETWVGKSRDKAEVAAGQASSTPSAEECAKSPTLTDISASAAGLKKYDYTFEFKGDFYKLHTVFDGILDMVQTRNGRVKVTGRLLDINSINLAVATFPTLTASVSMTGYSLPDPGSVSAEGAAAAPAGGTAAAPAAAPVN